MNKKTKKVVFRYTLTFFGILFLYALSEGPSYRFFRKETISQTTFLRVYGPIIFLCNHSKCVDYVFWKYESLWYSEAGEEFKAIKPELEKIGIEEKK